MIVASHNLMDGLRLAALIDDHLRLRDRRGLDLLCVQENERDSASRIAAALGDQYAVLGDALFPRLAMVYDQTTLRRRDSWLVALPRLGSLSPLERIYIASGMTEQKYALVATFETVDDEPFAAVDMHLETAGDNTHRRAQVAAIARDLGRRELTDRVIACGDTNAFGWGLRRQLAKLGEVLGPLAAFGATDPGTLPTHFFARMNEPKPLHRVAVALGRFGLDMPRRYDVVCTNLPVAARGKVTTPDSDHDLVWAEIET